MNIKLFVKLANLLDKYGFYTDVHLIDILIKKAYVIDFFHGTSSVFLHNILKEGLDAKSKKRVWDEARREPGQIGLESYPGTYITNNFMTAYTHSRNAIEKFGGNRIIISGSAESRTPEARVDEDHIREPDTGITMENKIVMDWYKNSRLLANYAFDTDEKEIERLAIMWIKDNLKIKPTDELKNRGKNALRAWLTMRVALEYEREKQDRKFYGISNELNIRFKESVPDIFINPNKAVKEYRKAMDEFLAKAKELLQKETESKFMINIRMTKPIAYKGANKIKGIVEIIRPNNENISNRTEFEIYKSKNTLLKIHYSRDGGAERIIQEYSKNIGKNYEII